MSAIIDLITDIFRRRRVERRLDRRALNAIEAASRSSPHSPELALNTARTHAAAGSQAEAIEYCRAALDMKPDFSEASLMLATLLRQALNIDEAVDVLRRARDAAPGDPEIVAYLRHFLGTGRVPMWHFSMMNDMVRNEAYERAIRAAVRPGDHVLEIGTGSGLLAMMAARAGAALVTSCESVKPIADKARQIIAQNGYAARVNVISKDSRSLQIPGDLIKPADVLVSEVISSDLLSEGVLDIYDDARRRLLKPDARVLPRSASVMAQLAGADELANYVRVGSVAGFDLSSFNEFVPVTLYPRQIGLRLATFSAPFEVFRIDFQSGRVHAPEKRLMPVRVTSSGRCDGVLQWVRLDLAPGTQYENAPGGDSGELRAGHWQQALYTFPQPLRVQQEGALEVVAIHDRSKLMFYCAS